MIRVALADDHAMVRDGLHRTLEASGEITVVIEAETGEELMGKIATSAADVCVMDLSMPGMGGLQAIAHLRRLAPEVGIIALSFNPPGQYAVRAIQAGASAYLTKESPSAELVQAVLTVAQGGRYLTDEVQDLLFREVQSDTPAHAALSDREMSLLLGLAEGKKLSEIAVELGISSKTLSTYRARVLRKLDLQSTADLVGYAVANGLVAAPGE